MECDKSEPGDPNPSGRLFRRVHPVKIVYVEASRDAFIMPNRRRNAVVPRGGIERMMDRWEVSDQTEAQDVERWIDGVQDNREIRT